MSSPASFEVLHAVSQRLADDFIDEDMSQIQIGDREVMNRTVTVRGRHRDRGVVLQYSDYFSEVINPLAPAIYERNLLELFISQPRVTFEGTCRDRNLWDKFLRLFGGGGLKGDAPVFSACRVDATDAGNISCLMHAPFSMALQQMAQQPGCRRVKMQAGAGVGPVLSFHARSSNPDAIMGWLDQGAALASTLDG